MKNLLEKKPKSTIQQLRDIRDKIGIEIQDLNYDQLMKYIDSKIKLHPKAAKRKWG